MLIGIDASRANRNHKSGTEWYSYYLIRWLAKLDSKNQYILYTDRPLKNGLLDLTTKQHINEDIFIKQNNKIKFTTNNYQKIKSPHNNVKVKILKWPFPFFWTQIRLSWEMLTHRPKILFIPAHTLPIIHSKRSIVTIHDIGFEKERKLYEQNKMGPENAIGCRILNCLVKLFTFGKYGANVLDYHKWSTKFTLKHAKTVITVSNFSKQEILKTYNAKETKIKVIYNGYNKYLYKKIDDKEKIKQTLHKYDIEGPFIFYVGRLEKKKNTPALIEAYAIMRDKYKKIKHKLVLVGDASYGYDEVKYLIREFNLIDDVITTGWIPEIDMPYIYNRATAFIYPSKYEGFGIPLLQAMACGTPIIASNAASIPEVTENSALLFNPDNIIKMADTMAEIISNQAIRQKLIKNGFNRIKKFNWEQCAEETLEEIKKLRSQ